MSDRRGHPWVSSRPLQSGSFPAVSFLGGIVAPVVWKTLNSGLATGSPTAKLLLQPVKKNKCGKNSLRAPSSRLTRHPELNRAENNGTVSLQRVHVVSLRTP